MVWLRQASLTKELFEIVIDQLMDQGWEEDRARRELLSYSEKGWPGLSAEAVSDVSTIFRGLGLAHEFPPSQ